MKAKLSKAEIIKIVSEMGFHLNYDQFDVLGKNWMRFELNTKGLDEQNLRWIWYKDDSLAENFSHGAKILFKAGQKALKLRSEEFIDL